MQMGHVKNTKFFPRQLGIVLGKILIEFGYKMYFVCATQNKPFSCQQQNNMRTLKRASILIWGEWSVAQL